MKVSYSWLKEYLNIDLAPEKLSEILTNTGLEVGGIEEIQSIKGGLEGLVIAEVLTCEPHSNSDHLSCTTVDLGDGEKTPIVCGAPNVAAGQKVVVATVGTTLYDGDESFVIKKSKIRGEVSLGMICAEDEIGVGKGHDGIMELPADADAGTKASAYFNVENDIVFEIDLTPNRIDGASHIGVARDVAAFLKQEMALDYKMPDTSSFSKDNDDLLIDVSVENHDACPRYAGVTLTNIKVADSPEWLQNRLKSIGLSPINNVVDITNFVLHELGQPLHAFDASKVVGNKVVVKTLKQDAPFTTLDDVERKLHADDLMICNDTEGMCIAGVFGGADSGVTESTTSIFLESACFNTVSVRKTARRHGLNTDASFRFERGVDPNMTIIALKRAAILIKEIAGATISSDIIDIYPEPIQDFKVSLKLSQVTRLIGEEIPKDKIISILEALEIKVIADDNEVLSLVVPAYRVDVQRESDVIEEILRIYGYNTVAIHETVNSTLAYATKPDPVQLRNLVSDQLCSVGFNEMMANSLTKKSYYENSEIWPANQSVSILNPLSQDLNCMRQTLLFGALETVAFNTNRQNGDLKLYEFGNCYEYDADADKEQVTKKYKQHEKLSICVSGKRNPESWMGANEPVSFYYLKKSVENVLERLGVQISKLSVSGINNQIFSEGLIINYNNKELASLGIVSKKLCATMDVKQEVYFAELDWDAIMKAIKSFKVEFKEISKFPSVRRDLSLLLDNQITFNQIQELAFKSEKKMLKSVSLFDVYEGKSLGEGKKSYAVSFILADDTKTLKDKQIDKIMANFIRNLEGQLGAKLR